MNMFPYRLLLVFVASAALEKCTTPNDEIAECISLFSCPFLLDALATKQQASIEFVRKSACGFNGSDPLVCCGTSYSTTAEPSLISTTASASEKSLLPDRRYCGLQHTDDYFRTEYGIAINEFPWTAILLYEVKGEILGHCSGSLISNRYVLTAAHCVKSAVGMVALTGVRLGEYNIKNRTDCTDGKFSECSEPPVDFAVEKLIIYPGFSSLHHLHDIALLRLNQTVSYSDYIRPICLPLSGTKFAQIGDDLATSGWGVVEYLNKPTEIKKKILNKLITNEECGATYSYFKKFLTENQFCTIPTNDSLEITCQGDSGAPVMFSVKYQWHQEGVTSFGVGCHGRLPVVHTKVAAYLEWIVENIKADDVTRQLYFNMAGLNSSY